MRFIATGLIRLATPIAFRAIAMYLTMRM